MGFFDGWRKDDGPTLYGPLKTAVTADVLEAGLIYCTAIVAFSLFIVLPGFKGKQVNIYISTLFVPTPTATHVYDQLNIRVPIVNR